MYRGTIASIDRCPCAWKSQHQVECAAWSAFAAYRDGFLPNAGGIDDQPAPVVRAIQILQDECNRHEAWLIDEAKRNRG